MTQSPLSLRFHSGASLGALAIAVSLAAPAQAAEQCGPLVNGIVTCDELDGPFPTGIYYSSDGDLTVAIEDGVVVAPDGDYYTGVEVFSSNGSVVIDAGGATVSTVDRPAVGAFAPFGDVTVDVGTVSAVGGGGRGIATFSYDGMTDITVDQLYASADYSIGILAESATGDVHIAAGSLRSEGLATQGMVVKTGGDIAIEAGSVAVEGDYAWGINATSFNYLEDGIAYGDIAIDTGTLSVSGNRSIGAFAFTLGDVDLSVDRLDVHGEYNVGMIVIGGGVVNIDVGDALFTGTYTGGIVGFSYGEAHVKVGTVQASNGGGVVSFGVYGSTAEADVINVNGDYSNGIQGLSTYGDASIKVGEVNTNGFFGVAVNGDALKGHLTIEAGKITTHGDIAMGMRAMGRTADIHVAGPISTDGNTAFGILASTTHGDAVVRTDDRISTHGVYADGMWVTGRYGTADIVAKGLVSTTGDDSRGIQAVGEDGQVKVVANEVTTSGAGSSGIEARTRYVEIFLGQGMPDPVDFTGDISVTAETVRVTGAGSHGISAKGLGQAHVDAGTVTAVDGFAIETDMIENAAINVRKEALSTFGSAISAGGQDIAVTIASGATVAGKVDGIVVRAMGNRCTLRNEPDGSPNLCPNPGGEWDNPDPNAVLPPPGIATIDNQGTLIGTDGYAVRVESGTLQFANHGVVRGGVLLGSGDDGIDNAGRFYLSKTSDFGDGTDRFVNRGTLAFTALGAPASLSFLNLERFDNEGLIDLRNGMIGDRLDLSGNYIGTDGEVALDVSVANGTADRLAIAGAASGRTRIVLDLAAQDARLTSGLGPVLVTVGTGSDPDAFALDGGSRDIGFIRYGLAYDAASHAYSLQGVAGAGAWRQLNAIDGAAEAWHRSAAALLSSEATARDQAGSTDGQGAKPVHHGLWGQVFGATGKRNLTASLAGTGGDDIADYSFRRSHHGGQLGYDVTGRGDTDRGYRVGVVASYLDSQLDSLVSEDDIGLSSYSLGLYGSLTAGRLFGGVVAKLDRHHVRFDAATSGFAAKTNGSTLGLVAEGGVRLGTDRFFVEPAASLAWTRTDLDDVAALGQRLDFATADGLRGKLGASIGGRRALSGGGTLTFAATGRAATDFGGTHRLELVSGSLREALESKQSSAFAETDVRISYVTRGGVETFFMAEGEVGTDHHLVGGSAGMRLRF